MKTVARSSLLFSARRHWGKFLILGLCCGSWLAGSAPTESLSGDSLRELNREAQQLFRQANEAAGSSKDKAVDLYQKAVLRFEKIAREGGRENGKLYYNIGNCYFRMNDLGRAILNYLRAQQYIPQDPNLRQNLEYARSRRLDKIELKEESRILRTLLFWHYDLSLRTRTTLFTLAFGALWGLAGGRLFSRRPWLTGTAVGAGAVSLLLAGSILVEARETRQTRPGVVISPEVVTRKGDSDTYEPSFKEPLHAGAEFILVERRTDWLHIELQDGRRCWIPASSAELVKP